MKRTKGGKRGQQKHEKEDIPSPPEKEYPESFSMPFVI